MGEGDRFPSILGEILLAIVLGLENPSFLAKSDIFIPKCAGGGDPLV